MLFDGHVSRKVAADCSRVAQRKLQMLHAATILEDLKVPPGNHLESLKGERRVNTVFASTTNGGFASFGTTKPKARGK